jgi:hypothetical protein
MVSGAASEPRTVALRLLMLPDASWVARLVKRYAAEFDCLRHAPDLTGVSDMPSILQLLDSCTITVRRLFTATIREIPSYLGFNQRIGKHPISPASSPA